jgi:hypothetical protein
MMRFFWRWVDKKIGRATDRELLERTFWKMHSRIELLERLLKVDSNPSNFGSEITGDLGSVIRTVRPYGGELHYCHEIKKQVKK